jgi:hypothetical protein
VEITKYETHGRKLLVEFKCYRCKKTATRPFEECVKEIEDHYPELYDLRPPKSWENGGFYYPTFCPECKKAYEDFMKGGEG